MGEYAYLLPKKSLVNQQQEFSVEVIITDTSSNLQSLIVGTGKEQAYSSNDNEYFNSSHRPNILTSVPSI